MPKGRWSLIAAVLLGLEAAAVAGLVVWEVILLFSAPAESIASAVGLVVLIAIGAVALAAFAVGTLRAASWGRSGAIVAQLLVLAVAVGALTGDRPQPLTAALLAAPAVLVLGALALAVREHPGERFTEEASQ